MTSYVSPVAPRYSNTIQNNFGYLPNTNTSQVPISQLFPPPSVKTPPPFYKRPEVIPLPESSSFNVYADIPNLNIGNEGNLFMPFPSPYEEISVIYPEGYIGNAVAPIVPVPLDTQRVYIVPTPFAR